MCQIREEIYQRMQENISNIAEKLLKYCCENGSCLFSVQTEIFLQFWRQKSLVFCCDCCRLRTVWTAHICHFLSENGNVFNIYTFWHKKGKRVANEENPRNKETIQIISNEYLVHTMEKGVLAREYFQENDISMQNTSKENAVFLIILYTKA